MPELFTVLTGLAGGAKAVVTLFNVCVRAYNTIERSSSHGSEHTKLMVKFDIEKFRFLSWGASLSFVRGENEATPRRYEDIGLLISANVEGQTVQELIKRTLSAIVMTFGDTTELRKRYGLGPVASLDRPSSASQTSGEPFRETFKRFHSRIIRTQREASLVETMRWAILDGDKFKALIKEVHDWNDDLDNILKLIKRHNTHIRIMQCEIERMSSVDEISIIEEVSAGDNPTISGAASIRLQTIEAASTRETGSSVADANTISTRLSHGTSKSSGINPKLLETVEDVLRRLIFPELKAFKQENNRKKFERDHRSSVASGSTGTSGDSRDEVRVTRKVPTRSSAPDIKPKIRIDDRDVTVGESSRQTRREDRDGSLRYDRRSATEEREITRPRSRKSDENKTLLGTIGAAPGLTAAAAATHHQRSKDSLDETKESSVAAANTISTRLSYETAPTEPGQPNEAQPEHEDEQPEHNELTSDIPQNMRLFTGQTVARNFAQVSLADIDRHGQAIQDIRRADMAEFQRRQEGFQLCKDEIDRLKDNKGSHAPRRLLSEILRFARLPDHISIGLLNDDIHQFLASFEGPPGTPYERGIFYVHIDCSDDYPYQPPVCRFMTKIYHPNIDPQGKIFIISIMSLLPDPVVDDPLVPEIAVQYIQDRDTYMKNARLYTERYATGEKPSDEQLEIAREMNLEEHRRLREADRERNDRRVRELQQEKEKRERREGLAAE